MVKDTAGNDTHTLPHTPKHTYHTFRLTHTVCRTIPVSLLQSHIFLFFYFFLLLFDSWIYSSPLPYSFLTKWCWEPSTWLGPGGELPSTKPCKGAHCRCSPGLTSMLLQYYCFNRSFQYKVLTDHLWGCCEWALTHSVTLSLLKHVAKTPIYRLFALRPLPCVAFPVYTQ